jgi:hypothetical protein
VAVARQLELDPVTGKPAEMSDADLVGAIDATRKAIEAERATQAEEALAEPAL